MMSYHAIFQGFLTALHLGLCLVGMWCTLCRLNYMGEGTRHSVTAEYFMLGAACVILLAAHTTVWVFVLLACIMARFSATAKYWPHPLPGWSLKI